jgi:two-component system response regulator WspF
VLGALPLDLNASVLVVQHVSVEFVAGFVTWLSSEIARPVELARRGVVPRAGQILVASEDRHMVINGSGALEFRDEPLELTHRPAVDELFASLAAHARPGIALLLTGMGRDGADGLLKLRRAGWHTIAQDEASSIVWGMPGTAHRLGAASETLSLDVIGAAISKRMGRTPRSETRMKKEQTP